MSVLLDESEVSPASAGATELALLDESEVSPAPAGATGFAVNGDALELLGGLGRAIAIGVEAGEAVDEVSAGTVKLTVRWWHQRLPKPSVPSSS